MLLCNAHLVLRRSPQELGILVTSVASEPPIAAAMLDLTMWLPDAGAADLLDSCSAALPREAAAVLLDCLLSAAQDEWPSVSGPARSWLAGRASDSTAAPEGAPCNACNKLV